MKLQQLRYLKEVARSGLNISEAAERLHTSQPGVSKQIRLLEEELGVEIFVRHGKRLLEVTEPGRAVLAMAERILSEAENLKRVGEEFATEATGSLTIATTHTQARYALPPVIAKFREIYPKVSLALRQGSPTQLCEQVIAGDADLAIATEAIAEYRELTMLPCVQWNRCVVVPPGHPLLMEKSLTLEAISRHPVITYDFAFTGRSQINKAFEARGLAPNVVLTAIDSDVIKTYVGLGMGVGIIAKMAFDPEQDRELRTLDASHLFESSTTRIGIRRGAYLRRFAYDFIRLFAPHLTREVVDAAMRGGGSDYEL